MSVTQLPPPAPAKRPSRAPVFLMLFGFAAWFGAFLALGQLDADRLDGNSPAQMMAGAICLAIVGATFIVCASLSRDDD